MENNLLKYFEYVPEYQDRQHLKKRYVNSNITLDDLKDEQLNAFNKLVEFFNDKPEGGMFLLEGYAGTGKTYLISKYIEWFLGKYGTNKVAVTAPTNKAVKILREKADYVHTNLKYETIHKLLGLREHIDHNGNQVFKQEYGIPCSIVEYNLLIIDEVSMLSDELFDLIYPYVKRNNIYIIFVGDPAQIPPVNKADCLPFNIEWQERLGIDKVSLTKIIRQADTNPIIRLSMSLRNNLNKNSLQVDRISEYVDGKGGILFLNKGDADTNEILTKLLKLYFNSKNFDSDADFAKVIAWRNKTVDFMNNYIRNFKYNTESKLVIGEKLLANSPIIIDEIIVFTTNDEFEVLSFEVKTEVINNGDYALEYYLAKVQYTNLQDGSKSVRDIKIIHENSEELYLKLLNILSNMAKSAKKKSDAIDAWSKYYMFKQHFADVKYNYAITAHKSQGSTYRNVFVIENDLNKNFNVRERNRIKYTAFTRASNNLIIIL